MTFRPVAATRNGQLAIEGAGVHLHRAFGVGDPSLEPSQGVTMGRWSRSSPALSGPRPARFLLMTERLIQEAVAWHESFVMNTELELPQATRELDNGTFSKHV